MRQRDHFDMLVELAIYKEKREVAETEATDRLVRP